MTRSQDMLREASNLIGGARHRTYGHVKDDYTKVQTIFFTLTGVTLTLEQCLLFMASVKLARLRTNLERGTLHQDSLIDALGYLALQAEINEPT
jgi:hypothetical protein